MVFYKIFADLQTDEQNTKCVEVLAPDFLRASYIAYEKSKRKCYIFVSRCRLSNVECGAIVCDNTVFKKTLSHFWTVSKLSVQSVEVKEESLAQLTSQLRVADRADYIDDDGKITDMFDLTYLLSRRRDERFDENILSLPVKLPMLEKEAKELMCDSNLPDELHRIFACSTPKGVKGHPVHYVISTDDRSIRDKSVEILLSALRQKHRIENTRYGTVNYEANAEVLPGELLDSLYHMNIGGALVITFNQGHDFDRESDMCSDRSMDMITGICEFMKWYKNDVLTVFCLPKNSNRYMDVFMENIGSCSIVHITELPVCGEAAINYLQRLAIKRKVKNPDSVKEIVTNKDEQLLTSELNKRFDDWFSKKMKTEYYPEYANAATGIEKMMKDSPKGNAYEELEKMVGLSEAKSVIMRAVNYYKAQKLFADKGMAADSVSLHMVFTGNPGTAKTSVARIFARIMKDNGLLANGTLVEVGRADIVGRYVGQTAPLVKAAFKKAIGGVLFIDEAYSLVDDRDGSYGDEAINTIVQEMENHRTEVVVIFAGYPDKMERFLNKNPGLRSRIAFHVPFADYNSDELCRIAELMADSKGFVLTDDALDKLRSGFEEVRRLPDFGNGRCVRNVLEQAKMALSERILKIDYDGVTKTDITHICADDISFDNITTDKGTRKIGFCV